VQAVLDAGPRERSAGTIGEYRGVRRGGKACEPEAQLGGSALPQRNDALFAPFPVNPERRGSIEEDVSDADRDRLGDARSGVVQDGEEDGVALPAPRRAVGSSEDGVDLVAGEVAEDGLVDALGRDRENALRDGKCGGVPEGGVAQEGADRREAEIAVRGQLARFSSR
jgi:hypothetical protein